MTYYIKSINFENESEELKNYWIKNQDTENHIIDNLGKINIFVGENNSGKSSFLRRLQSIDKYSFKPSFEFDIKKRNYLLSEFKKYVESIFHDDKDYFNKIRNTGLSEVKLDFNDFIYSNYELFYSTDALKKHFNLVYPHSFTNQGVNRTENFNNTFDQYKKDVESNFKVLKFDFEKIYIPVLRGLRHPIHKKSIVKQIAFEQILSRQTDFSLADFSKERTLFDYPYIENKTDVFTGLSLYDDIKKLLLGTHKERKIIKDFEDFLSEKFFNNQVVTITPKHDDDVVYVRIGDDENTPDIPIYNLGDGIQSIIILTFPLFKNQGKKLLVFIEEPELYLHPSMQRILVETFLDEKFNGFQYFIATHSNHLLDLTLDLNDGIDNSISVFTCKKDSSKEQKFIIENVSSDDDSPLKLLGVRNSSIFLSNCTIWVEGVTDRLYLRHYLDLYQNKLKEENKNNRFFKEDLHFSFVEYGGNNITHWSFLDDENDNEPTINFKKVCNKVFLIADKDYDESESSTSKKKLRHGKLEEFAKENKDFFQFKRLDCIEIENLINYDVIIKILKEYEEKNDKQLNLKNPDFKQEDYKNKKIGAFIDNDILTTNRKGRNKHTNKLEEGFYKYSDESGTIKDKVDFCKKAIKNTNYYEELSEEAKNLCKSIYDFIKEHNPI